MGGGGGGGGEDGTRVKLKRGLTVRCIIIKMMNSLFEGVDDDWGY